MVGAGGATTGTFPVVGAGYVVTGLVIGCCPPPGTVIGAGGGGLLIGNGVAAAGLVVGVTVTGLVAGTVTIVGVGLYVGSVTGDGKIVSCESDLRFVPENKG